eukprot:CAMPEP_0203977148 /NCGR_PEP_ID=MMETSP0359-20131031/101470_1 /ASSEMBLY_ACC=CAM_ASM_000338 /TAXON_ID=268821 /ORGANISM="Scrippsiella Hangoei, Strain SHTV-5" /LENGTH=1084 /DNA_ID=CAMNT_0050915357 /DNA_START=57 /DNA_END=3308 /DNA_ORIENTATION=-
MEAVTPDTSSGRTAQTLHDAAVVRVLKDEGLAFSILRCLSLAEARRLWDVHRLFLRVLDGRVVPVLALYERDWATVRRYMERAAHSGLEGILEREGHPRFEYNFDSVCVEALTHLDFEGLRLLSRRGYDFSAARGHPRLVEFARQALRSGSLKRVSALHSLDLACHEVLGEVMAAGEMSAEWQIDRCIAIDFLGSRLTYRTSALELVTRDFVQRQIESICKRRDDLSKVPFVLACFARAGFCLGGLMRGEGCSGYLLLLALASESFNFLYLLVKEAVHLHVIFATFPAQFQLLILRALDLRRFVVLDLLSFCDFALSGMEEVQSQFDCHVLGCLLDEDFAPIERMHKLGFCLRKFAERNEGAFQAFVQERLESVPLIVPCFSLYRFSVLGCRGPAADAVQLSGLEFRHLGTLVSLAHASATNPSGSNPQGEGPEQAIDGIADSKWVDRNKLPLIVQFPERVKVDEFRFVTAKDEQSRDPLAWDLEGSNDGATWTPLHRQAAEGCPTPLQRKTATGWFLLREAHASTHLSAGVLVGTGAAASSSSSSSSAPPAPASAPPRSLGALCRLARLDRRCLEVHFRSPMFLEFAEALMSKRAFKAQRRIVEVHSGALEVFFAQSRERLEALLLDAFRIRDVALIVDFASLSFPMGPFFERHQAELDAVLFNVWLQPKCWTDLGALRAEVAEWRFPAFFARTRPRSDDFARDIVAFGYWFDIHNLAQLSFDFPGFFDRRFEQVSAAVLEFVESPRPHFVLLRELSALRFPWRRFMEAYCDRLAHVKDDDFLQFVISLEGFEVGSKVYGVVEQTCRLYNKMASQLFSTHGQPSSPVLRLADAASGCAAGAEAGLVAAPSASSASSAAPAPLGPGSAGVGGSAAGVCGGSGEAAATLGAGTGDEGSGSHATSSASLSSSSSSSPKRPRLRTASVEVRCCPGPLASQSHAPTRGRLATTPPAPPGPQTACVPDDPTKKEIRDAARALARTAMRQKAMDLIRSVREKKLPSKHVWTLMLCKGAYCWNPLRSESEGGQDGKENSLWAEAESVCSWLEAREELEKLSSPVLDQQHHLTPHHLLAWAGGGGGGPGGFG